MNILFENIMSVNDTAENKLFENMSLKCSLFEN